jgi:hypothetical protein
MLPYTFRYPVIIFVAVALHLIWAAGLIIDPSSVHVTATHAVLQIAGSYSLSAFIFALTALLATIGMVGLNGKATAWRYCLLLPQHITLWISAIGCIHAMFEGAFADGVERGHWFLIVDQMPVVLIACAHTFALYFMVLRDRKYV